MLPYFLSFCLQSIFALCCFFVGAFCTILLAERTETLSFLAGAYFGVRFDISFFIEADCLFLGTSVLQAPHSPLQRKLLAFFETQCRHFQPLSNYACFSRVETSIFLLTAQTLVTRPCLRRMREPAWRFMAQKSSEFCYFLHEQHEKSTKYSEDRSETRPSRTKQKKVAIRLAVLGSYVGFCIFSPPRHFFHKIHKYLMLDDM